MSEGKVLNVESTLPSPNEHVLNIDSGHPNTEYEASFISRILLLWVTPLIVRASRKRKSYSKEEGELENEDLFELSAFEKTEKLVDEFDKAWCKNKVKLASKKDFVTSQIDGKVQESLSLFKASLYDVIKDRMRLALILKMSNSTVQFIYPILIHRILNYVQKVNDLPVWHGYLYVAALAFAMILKAILENNYFFIVGRSAWGVRSTVASLVYRKALRLSASSRQKLTVGQIVNLMQLDSTKLELFVQQVCLLYDGAYQIFGYMVIIYMYIGPSSLVGLCIMILAMPIQVVIFKKLHGLGAKVAKLTDERVKRTNEGLQGIQAVKMAAWEHKLSESIDSQREEELKYLRSQMYLRSFSSAYMMAMPAIVGLGSILTYAALDGAIVAPILYAALIAFGQLRFPLMFYPMVLSYYANAKVSASRIAAYLSLSELEKEKEIDGAASAENESLGKEVAILIANGEFYWENPINVNAAAVSTLVNDLKKTKGNKKRRKKIKSNKVVNDDTASGNSPSRTSMVPVLKNIDLTIKTGSLTAIIGPVGSGKSSLVNAMLGEMYCSKGKVSLNDEVALVSQTAWICNATIRENILFGEKYVESKYAAVIKACQLTHDLNILDAGDQTIIGEKGINLSGGQKQRISVARAAYSGKQILIMDDPLSALDPKVAECLFKECVETLLKNRTIVFITNQLSVLPKCDHIIVLQEVNGKKFNKDTSVDTTEQKPNEILYEETKHSREIIEQGSYNDLMEKGSTFKAFIDKHLKQNSDNEKEQKVNESKANDENRNKSDEGTFKATSAPGKELMQKEERNAGAVPLRIYQKYWGANGPSMYIFFFLVLILYAAAQTVMVFQTYWITLWTEDASYEKNDMSFYLKGYAILTFLLAFVTFIRTVGVWYHGLLAAKVLHKKLLESVLHAPMSYFDTTPIGRIINRFSKDLYLIDNELPRQMSFFLVTIYFLVSSVVTVSMVTPWFGVSVPFLGVIYLLIMNYYRPVSRDLKRLESLSRSPIYAHFGETLGGLTTIRAFGKYEKFMETNANMMNKNIMNYYNMQSCIRWLAIRVDLLGAVVTFLAAFLIVYQASNDSLSSGLAGLSLMFAMSITGMLGFTIRSFTELEAGMNSVERVLHYTYNIEQEEPYTYGKDRKSGKRLARNGCVLSNEWPSTGNIQMKNVLMRYRKDSPLVLKGLDIEIMSGERIGIVGRTGGGKSSLLLSLLRLVELDYSSNAVQTDHTMISIDGINIRDIGLHTLRGSISIVPQNPVIFSGTVRSNLDPYNEYSDKEILNALELCNLSGALQEMGSGLNSEVSEGGENFSQGQRQLLCLSRAVLSKSKILLLDEATSSVDMETDALVQDTISSAFEGCTVLTIAHRLQTVIGNDKILVMDDGKAGEFSSPEELLKNKNGLFYQMVHALGKENATSLIDEIAGNKRTESS